LRGRKPAEAEDRPKQEPAVTIPLQDCTDFEINIDIEEEEEEEGIIHT
jgi:hypothetical protein